jgi:hypothetical protein
MTRVPETAFGLARYAPVLDPAVALGLTRAERATIGGARASERAAGILAAKHAALRLERGWQLEELEVLRFEHAAPVLLVGGRRVGVRLSVAHAGGLAVAAATADLRRLTAVHPS